MHDNRGHVTVKNARIIFRNFSGEKRQFNDEGKRNFSIRLDDDQAEAFKREGWNVKSKPPRTDEDEWFHHLPVAVNFEGRKPPRVYLVTSRNRTLLDEDACGIIDHVEIDKIDLTLNRYDWKVNENTGVKAYLRTIYVTLYEDELDREYADIPDASMPQLESGEELNGPRVIRGEVVDESMDLRELEA